jgi:hypothetical protein
MRHSLPGEGNQTAKGTTATLTAPKCGFAVGPLHGGSLPVGGGNFVNGPR